jgi:RND superfamily putative drug exporter
MRALTSWSARHPWRVLAAWALAVLIGLVLIAAFIGDLTTESNVTNNPESEAWVPLFLFSVLFGLSMDYHVFLLSRIRERFARTRSSRWGSVSPSRCSSARR